MKQSDSQTTDRSSLLDDLYKDLPQVHVELGNPAGGVWQTNRACYEFIITHCDNQARTLETGLGLSTMLFLKLGTLHTCIAPWKSEVQRLLSHCQDRNISTERLRIVQAFSEEILPQLPQDELDFVMIDGGHGFPTPMIDWYYGASRLCQGGILVIDDIHLPAVHILIDFLNADPRWESMQTSHKWVAYRRLSSGRLQEDHGKQRFWNPQITP